jgi:membrane protein CcdC involved in cytochrome C biogenesis
MITYLLLSLFLLLLLELVVVVVIMMIQLQPQAIKEIFIPVGFHPLTSTHRLSSLIPQIHIHCNLLSYALTSLNSPF